MNSNTLGDGAEDKLVKFQIIIQGLKSLNLYKIVKGTVNIILKGPCLKIPIETFYLSKIEKI